MYLQLFLIYSFTSEFPHIPVVDPGFPVGGVDPFGRMSTADTGAFQWKMCVEMKEFGPVGKERVLGTSPRFAYAFSRKFLRRNLMT